MWWILVKIGLWRFLDKILPISFLRDNYDGSSDERGLTYQGQTVWFFLIGTSVSILFLFLVEGNDWANLGMFLIFFLPGLILLLRIRTFNDSNILSETGLGYDTFNSWKLFWVISTPGFLFGFSGLGFNTIPLYTPIIIPLAFICSIVPMFPDYVNKYLSYDIRSKKGIEFLRIFSVCAFIIQIIIIVFF